MAAVLLVAVLAPALAPARAWAASSAYLISLTDAAGNDILKGDLIDPDAVYQGLYWQFQVPADYATDPNAIASGFRMTITDSAGNYVSGVRALGYLDPGYVNGSNVENCIMLLPGETYTFSFAWITCTHLNGVGAEGSNGEVVVARESFTASTSGAPQGDADEGEGGEETTPPAGSTQPDGDGASPDDAASDVEPGKEELQPDEAGESAPSDAGTASEGEEGAAPGTANDEAVDEALDDVFYGAPAQEGSVRPRESAQTATRQTRAAASDALESAARAAGAGASSGETLAQTGSHSGSAGLSAEKLMGLGSVHTLQSGSLSGGDAADATSETPLQITTALVLRWVLLLAAVFGAAPAGALVRFARMRLAVRASSRLCITVA